MICAVLDPGAAHMSNTTWSECTSRSSGGIIDTASCLRAVVRVSGCVVVVVAEIVVEEMVV